MKHDRTTASREALYHATQLRRQFQLQRTEPCNPVALAESMGVAVKFVDIKSLEGMFARTPSPVILLPSTEHRPFGRIAFSCAHELGHYLLGHGTQVDNYISEGNLEDERSLEEIAADYFATSLLMPRAVVESAFSRVSLKLADATPLQLQCVADALHVSLGALIKHVVFGLRLESRTWLNKYRRIGPKQIITPLFDGMYVSRSLVLSEAWFPGCPIELDVGDRLFVSNRDSFEPAEALRSLDASAEYHCFEPISPGSYRVRYQGIDLPLLIAKRWFCGISYYRHLELPAESD